MKIQKTPVNLKYNQKPQMKSIIDIQVIQLRLKVFIKSKGQIRVSIKPKPNRQSRSL